MIKNIEANRFPVLPKIDPAAFQAFTATTKVGTPIKSQSVYGIVRQGTFDRHPVLGSVIRYGQFESILAPWNTHVVYRTQGVS